MRLHAALIISPVLGYRYRKFALPLEVLLYSVVAILLQLTQPTCFVLDTVWRALKGPSIKYVTLQGV